MFSNILNLATYMIIILILRSSHTAHVVQTMFLLCIVFFRYTAVVIIPILSIMTPLLTSIKNDVLKTREMYKQYYQWILIIGVITLIICKSLFAMVITRFYASTYWELPAYFNFFTYMIPLSFLSALNASVMGALGKIKLIFRIELICILLLVLLCIYGQVFIISDHHVFYYMLFVYLTLRFLFESYGAYRSVYR